VKGASLTVKTITTAQTAALIALFAEKLPLGMSKERAQEFLGNPSRFEKEIEKIFLEPAPVSAGDLNKVITSWTDFYQKFFGIDLDMAGVKIPAKVEGFDRLIVVPQGITPDQVWEVCEKQFNCYKCTDSNLGEAVTKNDRNPNDGTYAIWIRDVVEADEEMKNPSAKTLEKQGVKGITLLERLLIEIKYFSETNGHLDLENVTLCSGSRDSGGFVPVVDWDGDELRVGWYDVEYSDSHLRFRVVVSL
jgi:hypothetical protein